LYVKLLQIRAERNYLRPSNRIVLDWIVVLMGVLYCILLLMLRLKGSHVALLVSSIVETLRKVFDF